MANVFDLLRYNINSFSLHLTSVSMWNMKGCRAYEVPLRACPELKSNTLDPSFLVGNTAAL